MYEALLAQVSVPALWQASSSVTKKFLQEVMYLEAPLSKYQASLDSLIDKYMSSFEGSYIVYMENAHSS